MLCCQMDLCCYVEEQHVCYESLSSLTLILRLERRFLDRVAQTNRVKSTGVAPPAATNMLPKTDLLPQQQAPLLQHHQHIQQQQQQQQQQAPQQLDAPNPPWLQPPLGFKPGWNRSAAAAGRAALGRTLGNNLLNQSTNSLQRNSSLDALMGLDLQSIQSIDNLANLIQAQPTPSDMRNADFGTLLRTLSQSNNLNSATSASNLSTLLQNMNSNSNLQSLANASSFSSPQGSMLNASLSSSGMLNSSSGMLNASTLNASTSNSFLNAVGSNSLLNAAGLNAGGSSSLLNAAAGGSGSLLQASQGLRSHNSALLNAAVLQQQSNNLAGLTNASAASLANLLQQRGESSTGLSAMRNGQRNSSVDDFLSLMAAGDIPHQDASLLDVPLVQQQQQQKRKADDSFGQSTAKRMAGM